jgi:Fur family transcriptional regulator, ferric uptake regulator
MSCSNELGEILRARGFRMTPQRHAIIHILKVSGGHLSPNQVYEQARQTIPGITETTIYRTLEFLAENGLVQPALNGKRHLVYEITDHDHHHLICDSCGAEVNIAPGALQLAIDSLENQTGYRINAGHYTFFGLCPACKSD